MMSDFRLGAPEYLWGLWLVPLMALFFVYAFRTKQTLLERFASPQLLLQLTAGVSRQRQVIKAVLVTVGFMLAVLSLAQIRFGFTWENVRRRGVDIVVALDVSDSMLVQDAAGGDSKLSRLERAKREIVDLLKLMDGDRIALVAFAGTAFVECPLTLDYSAASVFLDDIDTDLIPVKGTALDEAISTSVKVLEGSPHNAQAIILITDGEDHSGAALKAAEEAKARGIRIFTIGIGRDEGAPIPAPGGGFHRDGRGEMVLSRLDEPALQKIALETGGRYVRSMTGDVDLESIYKNGIKALLEDQELGSKRRQRWEERFQWVVGLALLVLAGEALIPERLRKKAVARVGKTDVADGSKRAAAVVALLFVPTVAHADGPNPYKAYDAGHFDQALQGFVDLQVEHPNDPALMLNVASSHYKMGNYADADKAFNQAALNGNPAQREQALYGLGNCAFRQGKLEDALKRYQGALELNPDDADAKFNIEFVRDEIRRRHEQAQKQQQEHQQKQEQQKQDGEQQPQDPNGQQQQQDAQKQDAERKDGTQDPNQGAEQKQAEEQKAADANDKAQDPNQGQAAQAREEEKPPDGEGKPEQGGEAKKPGEGMTKQEAERYLDGVNEQRPKHGKPQQGQRRGPGGKDW